MALPTRRHWVAERGTIRTYALDAIPGLLQTIDYSAHLLRGIPPAKTPEQLRVLLEIRQRRQQLLLDSNSETRLITVIDEAALHRVIGSEEEMWSQLDRLRDLSERNNISIRILPFDAGAHAGLAGMFTIFQFADDIDRDVVSIETHSGDRYLEEQSSVLEFLRMFDAVTHKSLDDVDARDLLTKLMSNLSPPKDKR